MPLIDETIERIDKPSIEKRVKDWKKRVEQLYKDIAVWLKGSPYSLKINPTIQFEMYEEPMDRVGLPPVKIAIAGIYKENRFIGKISPFGLWIMGANGAVELNTKIRSYKIVDTAGNFEKPKWKIVERNGFSEHLKPFNSSVFHHILDASIIF